MFTTPCNQDIVRSGHPRRPQVVGEVCTSLSDRGLIVNYLCTEGDPGYNEYHRRFFTEWHARFQLGQLTNVIEYALQQPKLPVPDFLHLWKVFCNRVKNHSVTFSLDDCTDFAISADSLKAFLKLGAALPDRSCIGKMRDSDAL
jgi:hypothetical protein